MKTLKFKCTGCLCTWKIKLKVKSLQRNWPPHCPQCGTAYFKDLTQLAAREV